MLRFLNAAASIGVALALSSGTASAQWFGRQADCNCGPQMSASMVAASYAAPTVSACAICAPVVQTVCAPAVQPVMQTVYKQVPVTEYQPVKETVKRQVFETKYVDQAVTEYRPITETKVVDVPTVSYQNVTECQTQYRNVGYWRTRYEPNCRMSPCQYDQRPGLTGWLNRTGYEVASIFQPPYRTSREYVPQTIAQAVPVTRQVAIQGSRQVAYNITKMEPYQTTRKVAQIVPRWENAEVTVMKPITVVKTMAVGTQVAYVPLGAGTATAFGPSPDPIGTARGNTNNRSADALDQADPSKPNNKRSSLDDDLQLRRKHVVPTIAPHTDEFTEIREQGVADADTSDAVFEDEFVELGRAAPLPFPSRIQLTAAKPASRSAFVAPSSARVSQWVARTPNSPSLETAPSGLSVAGSVQP